MLTQSIHLGVSSRPTPFRHTHTHTRHDVMMGWTIRSFLTDQKKRMSFTKSTLPMRNMRCKIWLSSFENPRSCTAVSSGRNVRWISTTDKLARPWAPTASVYHCSWRITCFDTAMKAQKKYTWFYIYPNVSVLLSIQEKRSLGEAQGSIGPIHPRVPGDRVTSVWAMGLADTTSQRYQCN